MMKTNKIFIVGGGSAGWMAAATLISQFPNKDITVIESPNIPTVGVGESTLGQINHWLDLLNIKDEDFMPYTDASYKLSIRFENFYKNGDGGFHYPFGEVIENNKIGLKQVWFLKKKENPDTPITNYADSLYPNMALVNHNVLFKNDDREIPEFDFKRHVAYHFDATKFGLWLKNNYCIPRGVKHILEDVNSIETNEDGITSLNNKHKADMFIDCTGFKSLLLGKTLKEHFNDYSKLRSHPSEDASSQLSPYFHFGHISTYEVFEKIINNESWSVENIDPNFVGRREGWWGGSANLESFFDELITWRELGYHTCVKRANYDQYQSLPDWAIKTLDDHANDEREYIYDLSEFTNANTHDEIWNAAQNQLKTEGRIHNYLRMLWGKKILEWTPNPQIALSYLIDLNDRFALDGRDPNSYSGVFWILGRYDRAWGPERPIYGKIRYMTSKSTATKFNLKPYLEKWSVGSTV